MSRKSVGGEAQSDRQGAAPPGFVEALFGRTAPEDIAHVDTAARERLAGAAYAHVADRRQPDRHDIRIYDQQITGGDKPAEVTVVEIVNDNMPFLLDSTLAELGEQGYEPRLVAHPILAVERAPDGTFRQSYGEAHGPVPTGARRESLIHIHIDRIDAAKDRERLKDGLDRTFTDVRLAVDDWAAMRVRLAAASHAFKANPPPLDAREVSESTHFLDWIADDNFTLLGIRQYRFVEGDTADPVADSGLGILRDPDVRILRKGRELVVTTPEIRAFLDRPVALIITKANVKSRVHRRVHLDYVGVKLFAPDGRIEGELRIVGLFTSSAYTRPSDTIPYLRHKVSQVVARAGFDPASYSGRALLNVLDSYPRDELFQVDVDTLYRFALAIMQLSERPRLRALARVDEFDRFVSVLVYVPKDRYDTRIRVRIGEFLARVFKGRVSAAYPAYPEGPLARTHFIIGRYEGETPRVPQEQLESGISAIVRTWADGLRDALAGSMGGVAARTLGQRYADAFNAAYREAFAPADAIGDIAVLETLTGERDRAIDLYHRDGDPDTRVHLKVFARGASLPLSQRVPMLENLGFRVVNERTYRVVPAAAREADRIWLHDMALERAAGGAIAAAEIGPLVEASIMAQFRGAAESDRFDSLVLEAGLGWRDVALVRTLGRFLRQARSAYAQDYLAQTLARHAGITRQIVDLFHARFDPRVPARERDKRQKALRAEIETALAAVSSLDDDKILRRFVNLVEAAVRTNFFQVAKDGLPRATIALKFESGRIEGLPLPRPLYEIFLYSPRVEGVHLRFGKVARGGLRWSDRPQDFRTEVLGLVKAQQVKNAVIVPVGAKGGFVPKHLPSASDRQAWLAEGTEAYRIFIRTLLELTDNIVDGGIVPPENTVRHDGDDPYLVVAADKGTATFSDTANALSLEKGHWLGDAFASGGSQGYDHKKMGITARGAWEAVKRHFREINVDIQTQPVRVAGVGDMSGDVFGNGMLLSPALKLVAAFDHRDIFLDPDPDPAVSFKERQRLFDLPRSSWQDYDTSLISKGGGIFPRSAKSLDLSPQVRDMLGIAASTATPAEVMNAILKAKVDLLWFGGIGTYIRSSEESDDQVGDRANDAIRITGAEVGAKVIGEGANLGMTQRGRIEAARAGVRLNTDAIDNSAGVNTSDVEVNIKIALAVPEADGRLKPDDRNALLASMTDEVAGLVLRNNYLQSLALSLSERRGTGETGFLRQLMRRLEAEGRLDRAVEFLPTDQQIAERDRRGEGLTRPEMAVLLAYAKLSLHDALVASSVPDEPYLSRELQRYFPEGVKARFPDAVEHHRLRREIVATQLANALVNRGGPAVVSRLMDETGADPAAITRAYAATRDAYDLVAINGAIDALDGAIDGARQLELYGEVQNLTLNRLVWFLRNTSGDLETVVARFRKGIAEVAAALDAALLPDAKAHRASERARWVAEGVPDALAARIADLPALSGAPDIVLVAAEARADIATVAATYFAVDAAFKLGALVEQGQDVTAADYYDRLALDRALGQIAAAHRQLAAAVAAGGGKGVDGVDAWIAAHAEDVDRVRAGIAAIVASGLTVSKLTVAASLLDDLARRNA